MCCRPSRPSQRKGGCSNCTGRWLSQLQDKVWGVSPSFLSWPVVFLHIGFWWLACFQMWVLTHYACLPYLCPPDSFTLLLFAIVLLIWLSYLVIIKFAVVIRFALGRTGLHRQNTHIATLMSAGRPLSSKAVLGNFSVSEDVWFMGGVFSESDR